MRNATATAPRTASCRNTVGRSNAAAVAYRANAVAGYDTDSVITVPIEMAEGMATDKPAARTAHQAEASRRARRYTGTAVSAKQNALATLNHSYAASTFPVRRMMAASKAGKRGP